MYVVLLRVNWKRKNSRQSRQRAWLSGYLVGLAGISGWAAQPCMFDISPPRPNAILNSIDNSWQYSCRNLLDRLQQVTDISGSRTSCASCIIIMSTDAESDPATIPVEEDYCCTSCIAVGKSLGPWLTACNIAWGRQGLRLPHCQPRPLRAWQLLMATA